jgi:hypothetical protein
MRTIKIKRKKKKTDIIENIEPQKSRPKIQVENIVKPRPKIRTVGRWCNYYPGRLPYPIECSYNKEAPISYVYEKGTKTQVKNFPECPSCKRDIKWVDWKEGKWSKVIAEIKKGADLRDQPSPCIDPE